MKWNMGQPHPGLQDTGNPLIASFPVSINPLVESFLEQTLNLIMDLVPRARSLVPILFPILALVMCNIEVHLTLTFPLNLFPVPNLVKWPTYILDRASPLLKPAILFYKPALFAQARALPTARTFLFRPIKCTLFANELLASIHLSPIAATPLPPLRFLARVKEPMARTQGDILLATPIALFVARVSKIRRLPRVVATVLAVLICLPATIGGGVTATFLVLFRKQSGRGGRPQLYTR